MLLDFHREKFRGRGLALPASFAQSPRNSGES